MSDELFVFDVPLKGIEGGAEGELYYHAHQLPVSSNNGWRVKVHDVITGTSKAGKLHLQVVFKPDQEIPDFDSNHYAIERFFIYDQHGKLFRSDYLDEQNRDPYYFLRLLHEALGIKELRDARDMTGKKVRVHVVQNQANPNYTRIVKYSQVKHQDAANGTVAGRQVEPFLSETPF